MADSQFDYEMAIEETTQFVNSLFTFNALIMDNRDPDIGVLEDLTSDTDLWEAVNRELGSECVQTIVSNNNPDTKGRCPFFRVFQCNLSASAPTNFKLQSFYKKIGMPALAVRCSKAMVVALSSMNLSESPISFPSCFTTTTMILSDFLSDEPEIDVACLKPCGKYLKLDRSTTALMEIAGVRIPYYVPVDVQWRIMSYMQSVEASMIEDAKNAIMTTYDAYVFAMFSQREPRIPAYLASYYHAANVHSTTAGATRPFLVPSVKMHRVAALAPPSS